MVEDKDVIVVIGRKGCGKCRLVKKQYESKGVNFNYTDIDFLDDNTREEVVKKAKEMGQAKLPIIVKDGMIIEDYKELI